MRTTSSPIFVQTKQANAVLLQGVECPCFLDRIPMQPGPYGPFPGLAGGRRKERPEAEFAARKPIGLLGKEMFSCIRRNQPRVGRTAESLSCAHRIA